MKFWKILKKLLDEIFPEWKDKFISYKDLKKQLNLIYPVEELSGGERPSKRPRFGDGEVDGGDEGEVVKEDFVELLEREVNKFNGFFEDKEEKYIITLKMLKADFAEAKGSKEQLMKVGRRMVDFHGEMILLENYSVLNCIGLMKILKKYDKRSGNPIRMSFIQKVLQEPFFRTEILKELVVECGMMIDSIFPRDKQIPPPEDINQKEEGCSDQPETEEETEILYRAPEELAKIESIENMYWRLSKSALRTLKQIRNGSSTVSMFSFPPMEDGDFSDSG